MHFEIGVEWTQALLVIVRLDVERFFDDARTITDAARGPFLTKVQTALSVLRNYRAWRAPEGF